jgi:hypothetical protein
MVPLHHTLLITQRAQLQEEQTRRKKAELVCHQLQEHLEQAHDVIQNLTEENNAEVNKTLLKSQPRRIRQIQLLTFQKVIRAGEI